MRQIIASGLTAISLLLSITKPVRAQEYSAECVAAYSDRLAMLQEVVAEVIVEEEPVTQKWPDAPTDRPVLLIFQLVPHDYEINLDRQTMLDSTRDLIDNCDDIGGVVFARWGSGDFAAFGRLRDGSIDKFQCVEPGGRSNNRPGWGIQYCGL